MSEGGTYTKRELFCHVCIIDHIQKLGEINFAIAVLVCLHDRFVYDLLKLLVLQIATHHHFQHNE